MFQTVKIRPDVSFDIAKLSNWKRNWVFEEVKDVGQKQVSTRWVYTVASRSPLGGPGA